MRAAFCIYCGKAVKYSKENIAEAHTAMMAHDLVCPQNPMVEEIRKLNYRLSKMRGRLMVADSLCEHFKAENERLKAILKEKGIPYA